MYFPDSDFKTFNQLHTTIVNAKQNQQKVIGILGSANTQDQAIQNTIVHYFEKLSLLFPQAVYIIGGRGQKASVMDIAVEQCYQRKLSRLIVGIKPIFDLENRILAENIFAFENLSIRCYALTQHTDILIVFPGGLGTLQEIIVPLMHQKLDKQKDTYCQGPQAIYITEDYNNPTTEFLNLIKDQRFISQNLPLFSININTINTIL